MDHEARQAARGKGANARSDWPERADHFPGTTKQDVGTTQLRSGMASM